MAIPLYFAMTAAEFSSCPHLPSHLGWMSCHFSSSGNGLSNLPESLPSGSMLILDDSFPPCRHDPVLVAQQLLQCATKLHCDGILLDLQRPANEENVAFVSHIIRDSPCPVGLPTDYAQPGFPVFVPPVPPDMTLDRYLSPWRSHEIWLEAAIESARYRVDADGCTVFPLSALPDLPYADPALPCHYDIRIEKDHVDFILSRTEADLSNLLRNARSFGVTQAVGLWQELEKTSLFRSK